MIGKKRTAVYKGTIMDPHERDNFIMLTKMALGEKNPDMFVKDLMKRDPYISCLLKNVPQEFGKMAEECLHGEVLILERLEKERKETIKKIDRLSKNRKAVRTYSSKFPLPPSPVFFNKIG
jgi:hypothetical protein